jgi:hypothetical protein
MNRNLDIKVAIERRNFGRTFDFYLWGEQFPSDGSSLIAQAKPLVFEMVKDDGQHGEPTISVNKPYFCQSMMDELWRAGFRPSTGSTEGQAQSVERHLQDMRSIAFAKLEIPPPK